MKAGDIVYLTKYALSSKGEITTHEVKSIADSGMYVFVRRDGAMHDEIFRINSEVFSTEAEAIAACESARIKKEASLNKQIAALHKLKFHVAED